MTQSLGGKIIVVHGSSLLRDCLTRTLSSELSFEVVGAGSIDEIAGKEQGDISLVILSLGENLSAMSSIAEVSRLGSLFPETSIAVIADDATVMNGREALQHGLKGVISSSENLDIVVAAVRLILAGGKYASDSTNQDLDNVPTMWPENAALLQPSHEIYEPFDAVAQPSFTSREVEVLECLRQGLPNKTIASRLMLSENTVKVHLRHIMRKMQVKNRTEAALVFKDSEIDARLGRRR